MGIVKTVDSRIPASRVEARGLVVHLPSWGCVATYWPGTPGQEGLVNRLGEQDLTILGTKLYLNLQGVFLLVPPTFG